MKRALVYRPGDKVKIVNPVFVERVGYPLTWPMLREEVENSPKIGEAMRLLGIGPAGLYDFVRGVCQALVRTRGFGGRARTIHTRTDERAVGLTVEVLRKRTAYTGTYFPPHGGQCGWDGEYDFNPGGIDNAKCHVILETEHGAIEQIHVEKVEKEA